MKSKITFVLVSFIFVLVFNTGSAVAAEIIKNKISFQNEFSPEISGLKVFPNPVRNYKFKVTSDKQIKSIQINNILGQASEIELVKRSGKYFDVLLKDKKQGVYLVIVLFEDN